MEDMLLVAYAEQGLSCADIAREMGRQPWIVERMAQRLAQRITRGNRPRIGTGISHSPKPGET